MSTTSFTELAAEAQKQALSAFKQAQDLSIRTAELAVGLVPEESIVTNPKDVVEGAFGFAGQVLHQQKAYALRMTEIFAEAQARAARQLVPAE
jgi:hypothetical protein